MHTIPTHRSKNPELQPDREEERFVQVQQQFEGHDTRRRRTFGEALQASLLVLVLLSAFYYTTGGFVRSHLPIHRHGCSHHGQAPSGWHTYPGERIAWTPCGTLANRTLECSNITVPLDHFNTTAATDKTAATITLSTAGRDNGSPNHSAAATFSIPLLRMRSPNATAATRNLLVNPGGPGGSGTQLIYRKGAQLAAIVGDGFHLLGFDPRGVNGSRPRAACYPSDEARRRLAGGVRAKKVVEDSGELWAWSSGFARGCADAAGPAGPWVNTPQTAADMNSILEAVGQEGEGLYYWGFSYGTLLGQTYATLFPERATRVIIDGVANQFDWYGSLLDNEMLEDTDRVFDGFVEECVRAGEEDCALAGLAGTKEELRAAIVAGIEKLKDEPVGVYVNGTTYGALDYWAVWHNGVFPGLYKPGVWRELASNLAALLRGNATAAFLSYGMEKAFDDIDDAMKIISLNDGASGPDRWPLDRRALLDRLLPFFNQSLFGSTMYDFYFAKQAWAMPKTHRYAPKRGVKTAHPLLLLTTTYDPVCPLLSARSANEAFEGSRIVEVKGYGHCSIAVPSLCVAQHVRDFLYEGKLPDENVRCEVDGNPYFAKPEDQGAFARAQSLTEEERQIRLAQLELARDMWLRPWKM